MLDVPGTAVLVPDTGELVPGTEELVLDIEELVPGTGELVPDDGIAAEVVPETVVDALATVRDLRTVAAADDSALRAQRELVPDAVGTIGIQEEYKVKNKACMLHGMYNSASI